MDEGDVFLVLGSPFFSCMALAMLGLLIPLRDLLSSFMSPRTFFFTHAMLWVKLGGIWMVYALAQGDVVSAYIAQVGTLTGLIHAVAIFSGYRSLTQTGIHLTTARTSLSQHCCGWECHLLSVFCLSLESACNKTARPPDTDAPASGGRSPFAHCSSRVMVCSWASQAACS